MNVPYGLLPDTWHWLAALVYVAVLAPVVLRLPWKQLSNPNSEKLHVYLGTCVALMVFWTMKTTVVPGLDYHYLGATLLTLMFGWRLAIAGISIVLAATILSGSSDWQTFPTNVLLMGVLPVTTSYVIYRIVDRNLPNNFFIYVFLCAFFSAGAALLSVIACAMVLLIMTDSYGFAQIAHEYLPFAPLMLFPESFVTGMLITVIVALRPKWVSTFDDERYIRGR